MTEQPDLNNQERLPFDPRCNFCHINEKGGFVENGLFDKFYNFDSAYAKEREGEAKPIIDIAGISEDNVVYTDLAPLAPNHLMLIPNGHATSSVLMPDQAALGSDSAVMIDFMRQVNPGRSVVIFEHGSGIGNSKSLVSMCSRVCDNTVHAHVHFLPAPVLSPYQEGLEVENWDYDRLSGQLMDFLSPFGWDNNSPIERSSELYGSRPFEFVGERPYLMMGVLNPDGSYREITLLHDDDEARQVPSQTSRRISAGHMNGGRPASADK